MKGNIASLGAIALAYGGILLMSAAETPDRPQTAEMKAATKAAGKAAKALRAHDVAAAVAGAETAVGLAPTRADFRMILGQSYLQAGRFPSARQAFADALHLDRGNGRAALDLALTEIAAGDWQRARDTLAQHAETIPAGDRGLAMALAGDTAGGVAVLTEVAKSSAASVQVRQNLALAYALGGQWGVARMIVAADLSPADVDARLQQWAAFAQPKAASDQVASLLGVHPVADDAGQPAALALVAPVATPAVMVATALPVTPPAANAVEPVPAAPVAAIAPAKPQIVFGARREVVQPLAAPVIRQAANGYRVKVQPTRVAAAKAVTAKPVIASGTWFVQIGAFDSAGVAKDAWNRAQHRYAAFKGRQPNGATFRSGAATFFRLSVGGFSRAAADQACRQYRARGGVCFVRSTAGDQIAAWAKPTNVRLAAAAPAATTAAPRRRS